MDEQLPAPVIGRLSATGIVDVGFYACVVACCVIALLSIGPRRGSPVARLDARFWRVTAAIIFALGVWKAFDIEGLIQEFGPHSSTREGWYNERRPYQDALVISVLLIGLLLTAEFVRRFRRRHPSIRMGAAALALLLFYIAARTPSLHVVDQLLYRPILGLVRLNWIAEPGLLLLIAAAAAWFRHWQRSGAPDPSIDTARRRDRPRR